CASPSDGDTAVTARTWPAGNRRVAATARKAESTPPEKATTIGPTPSSASISPGGNTLRIVGTLGGCLQPTHDDARRADAVVDAHHGDTWSAARGHRRECRDPFERRSVPCAGRDGHEGRVDEPGDGGGQRAFHAGDHHQ